MTTAPAIISKAKRSAILESEFDQVADGTGRVLVPLVVAESDFDLREGYSDQEGRARCSHAALNATMAASREAA